MLAAAFDLLSECGASRLTTREVARRAGVSEGSVFYHFTDRTGLMTAVIEDGLQSLRAVQRSPDSSEAPSAVIGESGLGTGDLEPTLAGYAAAVEGFLAKALVVMIAAQSDSELRDGLSAYLVANDMGPHIGIQLLTDYIEHQRVNGLVRADTDAEAIAYFVYSTCFQRVAQRQMITGEYGHELPDAGRLMTTMARLLAPEGVNPESATLRKQPPHRARRPPAHG